MIRFTKVSKHYTRGGPWFEDWRHVAHADLWLAERDAMLADAARQARVGARAG